MRDIPVTPKYEFPVKATYNILDAIYEEVTGWKYFQFCGSYESGDYANIDNVNRIFHHFDDGTYDGDFCEITDARIVRGWICRQKLARAIRELDDVTKKAWFDREVDAICEFTPDTSESVTRGEEAYRLSIGEVAMLAPRDQLAIDDDEIARLAFAAGAKDLAAAYADYFEHYADRRR